LARKFRFYQKKRGNRRTGSNKLGSAGEAVFCAGVFLAGCGILVWVFVALLFPEWRANHEFAREVCVVLQTRIGEKQDDDGALYRPEVQIEYTVDGESYRIWTYDIHNVRGGGYSTAREEAVAILDRFQDGEQYVVYYDLADPNVAVLVRGSIWWVWLWFIVAVSLILIGGGRLGYGLVTWGKSAERRAAITIRAAGLHPFAGNGRAKPDFPYVPVATNTTDSPGTTLAFRLPVAGSPGWTLALWLVTSLLWNGIVSVFVVVAIRSLFTADPDWFLAIFTLPFVGIGIGLIVFFLRQLVVTTGIGPTLVEISDQPLYPGGQYQLFLSQTGRLAMGSLEMLLVCDEEATFHHGTDSRTETKSVYRQTLFRGEGLRAAGGAPFQTHCELQVPPDAMHSFKSGHNEITWKILVKGNPIRWPDFQRSFPVIVYPIRNGEDKA